MTVATVRAETTMPCPEQVTRKERSSRTEIHAPATPTRGVKALAALHSVVSLYNVTVTLVPLHAKLAAPISQLIVSGIEESSHRQNTHGHRHSYSRSRLPRLCPCSRPTHRQCHSPWLPCRKQRQQARAQRSIQVRKEPWRVEFEMGDRVTYGLMATMAVSVALWSA